MSQTFPLSRRSELGYDIDAVEKFLLDARIAYEAKADARAAGPGAGGAAEGAAIDSRSIRSTSFDLRKGGYSTLHVDAALERLEDAFSARERAAAKRDRGDNQWYDLNRERAREILARLEREPGHKFRRAGLLSGGYDRREVDAFCSRLVAYFRNGAAMEIGTVRGVVFTPRLHGYSETQVDLVLDAVIDVMVAVR
ncbi:DivIVA domain-containing protein [Subtercola sp. Z020]|uniref:DivIVA domain-containing protein n=1 Tax=Subtercola sp. Z020 TaxID=2080582 RepID=UPI000CE80DED|nr:DivIVA domain-containing protein [Subtercola sp. Z020]PPF84534.1 DivIVA domain-containing protein [Subtercola sp. Z020]